METKTEIADIKETKTEVADKASDIRSPDTSSFQPVVSKKRTLGPSSQTAGPKMRGWHWVIFVVICVLLGFLVLYTIVHVIDTTTSIARHVHAPSPVETVPVRRQTLEEVIGGTRGVEQAETGKMITHLTAKRTQVRTKHDGFKKKYNY